MTPRELADITVDDIIIRRLKAENDFYGYEGERSISKKRKWSVIVGGCRW